MRINTQPERGVAGANNARCISLVRGQIGNGCSVSMAGRAGKMRECRPTVIWAVKLGDERRRVGNFSEGHELARTS